jgi:hypothetical protein
MRMFHRAALVSSFASASTTIRFNVYAVFLPPALAIPNAVHSRDHAITDEPPAGLATGLPFALRAVAASKPDPLSDLCCKELPSCGYS